MASASPARDNWRMAMWSQSDLIRFKCKYTRTSLYNHILKLEVRRPASFVVGTKLRLFDLSPLLGSLRLLELR